MYKALYLSPMIPSTEINGTINFFTDLFQFKILRSDDGYAILYKDNLTVHISKVDKLTGGMEFYLEVSKLDELWESIKTNIAGLHVREPFDRDYGMREFHIGVPYTQALMFVGEDISKRN